MRSHTRKKSQVTGSKMTKDKKSIPGGERDKSHVERSRNKEATPPNIKNIKSGISQNEMKDNDGKEIEGKKCEMIIENTTCILETSEVSQIVAQENNISQVDRLSNIQEGINMRVNEEDNQMIILSRRDDTVVGRNIKIWGRGSERLIAKAKGKLIKNGANIDLNNNFMPDRYKHLEDDYKRGRKEDCERFEEFSRWLLRDNMMKKLDGLPKLSRIIIKNVEKVDLIKSMSMEKNLEAYKISVVKDEIWVEIEEKNWVEIPQWIDLIYEFELDGKIIAHNTLVHVRIVIPSRYDDIEGRLRKIHMDSLGLDPLFEVRYKANLLEWEDKVDFWCKKASSDLYAKSGELRLKHDFKITYRILGNKFCDICNFKGHVVDSCFVKEDDMLKERVPSLWWLWPQMVKKEVRERMKEEEISLIVEKKGCYNCKKEGHIASECLQKDEMGNLIAACFRCNELGHLARECENEAKCEGCKVLGHQKRDCESFGTECFFCKKRGHISRQCPERKKLKCFWCLKTGHMKKKCQNFINKIPRTRETIAETGRIFTVGKDLELEKSKSRKYEIKKDSVYSKVLEEVDNRMAELGWYQTYKQEEGKKVFSLEFGNYLRDLARDLSLLHKEDFITNENDECFIKLTREIWDGIKEGMEIYLKDENNTLMNVSWQSMMDKDVRYYTEITIFKQLSMAIKSFENRFEKEGEKWIKIDDIIVCNWRLVAIAMQAVAAVSSRTQEGGDWIEDFAMDCIKDMQNVTKEMIGLRMKTFENDA